MSIARSLTVLSCAILFSACGRPASHDNGVVISGNSACAECHLTNYQATSAPVHATVGYPTSCGDCHTTTAWKPAFAGHAGAIEAAFPTQTGKHKGIACLDCHNPALSASYHDNPDCTTSSCHQHDKAWFNSQHEEGTWSDTNHQFCRQCHPTGGHANGD